MIDGLVVDNKVHGKGKSEHQTIATIKNGFEQLDTRKKANKSTSREQIKSDDANHFGAGGCTSDLCAIDFFMSTFFFMI